MSKLISDLKRKAVFNKSSGRCQYCGCIIKIDNFQIDHIEPRNRHLEPSKRGSNNIDNLRASCRSCNASKSNFELETWRNELNLKYDRLIRDSSQFRILERFGVISRNKNITFYFEKNHG